MRSILTVEQLLERACILHIGLKHGGERAGGGGRNARWWKESRWAVTRLRTPPRPRPFLNSTAHISHVPLL